MLKTLHLFCHALLDFVYPALCLLCSGRLIDGEIQVCCKCWALLKTLSYPDSMPFIIKGFPALAVWEFTEDFQKVIHEFKFFGRKTLFMPLADRMARLAWTIPGFIEAQICVPVPLHKARLRERGFNQSLLLAERVAELLGLEVGTGIIKRVRHTRSQSKLSASERRRNVKGAFELSEGVQIQGSRIILIDDVFTTGATLLACAEVLSKGGARDVFLLTAARTLH